MTPDNKRIHSFTDDILGDLDAVGIAKLIKNKEIQSKEVVAATIERAKKMNPMLNAIVTDCYDKGLAQSQVENEGFFGGIPTFIKDMTLVEGTPAYFGSEAFANAKPATKTDAIAKQMFAQGFIHLGSSSMPEFGFTCSTEFANQPATRNPWNTDHSCGGSSGGAAALVGAGVVPLAHAADGGGSTRIPASCCGLVGLKPSRGRLLKSSVFDTQAVAICIDGVITRSVRDTAYFYAEAEKYYKNSKLEAIGLVEGPSTKKYKIGFSGNSVKDFKADEMTMGVMNDTAALLESMGHQVKPVDLTVADQFMDDFVNLWAMSGFVCRHFGKQAFGKDYDPSKLSKLTNGLAKHFKNNFYRAPAFIYRLRKAYNDYKKMFETLDVDIILTPTVSHAPPQIGYMCMNLEFDELFGKVMEWACFTPYSNASGGPSISLPLGHDTTNDLPVGMLFWGKHGQEKTLLDLSYQIEEAQPWKKIMQ